MDAAPIACYAKGHADALIARAHEIAAKLGEAQHLTTLLLYMDFSDDSTERLLNRFYPFSLPLAIEPFVRKKVTKHYSMNA